MSIAMLPVELLISVFEELQGYETKPGDSTRRWSPQWRVVRQVCKHWHDVADGHPKLWKTVDVLPSKHALDWVNLCVSKSGAVGLELRFHTPHAMREVCDALYAHTERIQKISAWGEETIRGLHALRPLFFLNLLNVQELHFNANFPRTRGFYNLDRDTRFVLTELLGELSPARLPALHTISLRGIFLPWESPITPNLRVLRLDRWDDSSPVFREPYGVPSDRFLHILASCTKLETLSLDVKNTDTHLRLPQSGTLPVIALPSLRRLVLTVNHFASRVLFVPLLAHIRVPPTCTVTIAGSTSTFDLAAPTYPDFLPAPALAAQSIPALARAVAATWNGPQAFSFTSDSGAALRLAVRDGREEHRRTLPDPDDALSQFCEYAREAPRLARLALCARVSEGAYARAFRTLAGVGVEELVAWTPRREDVRGLLSALAGKPESTGSEAGTPGSGAVLGGLRVLRLKGLVRYQGFEADVAECLRVRREAGARDVEVYISIEG
ncbi:hypothetical protein GSI_13267 [Ganoderma sinense ZZ0214-1]|uniref:F-box domain-containing protein n=1 Tax=Ganoderma sinense ZZ0214-1 TaxID=1077348 RepID=A0A2G8RV39_9APHY|nr:hypothetical protein GSI_13267 [Ganoderma sinense ZZ0214-1]